MNVEELVRKLRPVLGARADSLWLACQLESNFEKKRELEGLLFALAQRHLGIPGPTQRILLEPPPPAVTAGPYPLGTVIYNDAPQYAFGLRDDEVIQHVGVFGRSGAGKTNVALLLLKQLREREKPFLVFDWKRSFRDCLRQPWGNELLILSPGRPVAPFTFNPLIPPPGTVPTVWIKKLTEVAMHAYFLGEGVAYLLQQSLDSVYRASGAYSDQPRSPPTLFQVKDWINNYKATGRQALWKASTLRALGSLCFGEMGRVLNSPPNVALDELLTKPVILELDGLSDADKIFLIEALVLWIFHYRLQQPRRETFKHALLIDEAHHILLRRKQELAGAETVMDIALRELRELGEAVILADQNPSLISKTALANTNTTIALNLKHRSDVDAIGDSILLDRGEYSYLGQLPIGQAIVRIQSRWPRPFLVQIPFLPVEKGVITDSDLQERFQGYSNAPADQRPLHPESVGDSASSAAGKDTHEPPEDQHALLLDVAANPVSGISERYARLRFGGAKGNTTKTALVTSGYLIATPIRTLSGHTLFLQPTAKSRNYLRSRGVHVPEQGRGGPEHEYWKKRLAAYFRSAGYSVTEEHPLGGGRTVDLVIEKDGRRTAVEIETGKSDPIENVRKSAHAGFDQILLVTTRPAAIWNLRKKLDAVPSSSRVRILTVHEILALQTLP